MSNSVSGELSSVFPAVANLLADYARFVDIRDPIGFSRLFGTGGTLATPHGDITGPDALAAFAVKAGPGVHVQGVPTLYRGADGSLFANSNFIFISARSHDLTSGEYRDVIRFEDGRLVFARRTIDPRVSTAAGLPSE